MFWTQSLSGACIHIPSCTCFVAVRPTLEWTCRNSWKIKTSALFSRCTQGYSPGLNAMFEIWAFPSEIASCCRRFEKLWGENSLNAILNGRWHNKSPERQIWGLSFMNTALCPFFPLLPIFLWGCFPTSHKAKPHSHSTKIRFCNSTAVKYFRTSLTFIRLLLAKSQDGLRRNKDRLWPLWNLASAAE